MERFISMEFHLFVVVHMLFICFNKLDINFKHLLPKSNRVNLSCVFSCNAEALPMVFRLITDHLGIEIKKKRLLKYFEQKTKTEIRLCPESFSETSQVRKRYLEV